ncbi:EthD family reductase [Panacagrimonas sp.]|uniref:EthD family reductase n=1 Tax=Panacagrimonas sp. TaxID=2480088 RepID=UPI003B515D0C
MSVYNHWRLLGACLLLSLAACSKSGDPATEAAATATADGAKGTHFVTVLYNPPEDPAAFEKYYWETHVPLVGEKQAEIGFVAAELTHFVRTLDDQPSPLYRQAVLWFDSAEARDKGLASDGFKAVGDDLANFASGGLIGMVGEQTSEPTPLAQGDHTYFVTVLYQQPEDAAAFESYYADTHLPLVGEHAEDIQFTRAELTKLEKNLDGTPPAYYRQAKLYFSNEVALNGGLATPGFKAVGDDLGNFATGGLVALVGHLTSAPAPAAAPPAP